MGAQPAWERDARGVVHDLGLGAPCMLLLSGLHAGDGATVAIVGTPI